MKDRVAQSLYGLPYGTSGNILGNGPRIRRGQDRECEWPVAAQMMSGMPLHFAT